jgi:hypothetical protein
MSEGKQANCSFVSSPKPPEAKSRRETNAQAVSGDFMTLLRIIRCAFLVCRARD